MTGRAKVAVPTSYLSRRASQILRPRHRRAGFSGGSSGLCIGHISPEAAEGGASPWSKRATPSRSTSPTHPARQAHRSEMAGPPQAMKARGASAWEPAERTRKVFQGPPSLRRMDHQRLLRPPSATSPHPEIAVVGHPPDNALVTPKERTSLKKETSIEKNLWIVLVFAVVFHCAHGFYTQAPRRRLQRDSKAEWTYGPYYPRVNPKRSNAGERPHSAKQY